MILGDLRKYNVSQISKALIYQQYCDPEYAVLCAWYIQHNKPIQNWSSYYNRTLTTKVNSVPYIPKNIFEIL
jgi:hypothetical protein